MTEGFIHALGATQAAIYGVPVAKAAVSVIGSILRDGPMSAFSWPYAKGGDGDATIEREQPGSGRMIGDPH